MACSIFDLQHLESSSLIRVRTWALYIESSESYPLDQQGSHSLGLLECFYRSAKKKKKELIVKWKFSKHLPEPYFGTGFLSSPMVPNLSGTRDRFHGRQFFRRWRTGDGFRMIQARYIYCALYFYCYYISSNSDHQALDPGCWGPLL